VTQIEINKKREWERYKHREASTQINRSTEIDSREEQQRERETSNNGEKQTKTNN